MRVIQALRDFAGRMLGRGSTGRARASFSGGHYGRLLADWVAGILHPDREIQYNLRTLRARARELVRNNPYAAGFVETLADNVVGSHPDGIQIQAKIRNTAGALADRTNRAIERGWHEWGFPESCSADGVDSLLDIQRIAIKTWATDGECFIRVLTGPEWPYGIALQILDADMLDETFERPPGEGKNEIRMGVEINQYGRPVAYHFWDRHPSDRFGGRKRTPIPASEIRHLFVRYRPNQTRGYPIFAPVMIPLHHYESGVDAELIAMRMAACQGVAILNNSEEAIAAWNNAAITGERPAGSTGAAFDLVPGMISELGPGQDLKEIKPTHPNTEVVGFGKLILRSVAVGLHVSYGALTGDLSEANYSSMRAGMLPERDHYRALHQWMIQRFHRPIYRMWISAALLKGAVSLDSRLGSMYHEVDWKPRGWKGVDPLKDRQADLLGILMGVLSRQRVCAEEGNDFEEIIDELQYEESHAEGLSIHGTAESTERARQMTDAETAGEDQRRAARLQAV